MLVYDRDYIASVRENQFRVVVKVELQSVPADDATSLSDLSSPVVYRYSVETR